MLPHVQYFIAGIRIGEDARAVFVHEAGLVGPIQRMGKGRPASIAKVVATDRDGDGGK